MATFADYLIAPGSTRLRLVQQQIEQLTTPYNPGRDFYRPILTALLQDLRFGTAPTALENAVLKARPVAKPHFENILEGLGAKLEQLSKGTVHRVENREWLYGPLTVRVNPDFGLTMPDGSVRHFKVYFKAPALTKFTAEAMTHLMARGGSGASTDATPAVIDARRGRIWLPPKRPNARMDVLLESEARGYASMWKALSA